MYVRYKSYANNFTAFATHDIDSRSQFYKILSAYIMVGQINQKWPEANAFRIWVGIRESEKSILGRL